MSDQSASSPSGTRGKAKAKTPRVSKPKGSASEPTSARPSSDFMVIAQTAAIAELEERLVHAELGHNQALAARVRRLETDLAAYRETREALEFRSLDLRAALDRATAHNQALKESPAYRLGRLLIEAAGDLRALLRLPASLLVWRREARQYREEIEARIIPDGTAVEYTAALERALEIGEQQGLERASEWVVDQRLRAPVLARVLTELAARARKTDPNLAVRLAEKALDVEPAEGRVKRLAFLMSEAGSVIDAAGLLRSAIAKGAPFNASEEARAEDLLALADIAANGLPLKHKPKLARRAAEANVLIFAAQAYPHHWSSAAIRTHAQATALARAGVIVNVITRPGYPDLGAKAPKERPPTRQIDGVTYHLLPPTQAQPGLNQDYVAQTTRLLLSAIRRFNATTLIAPSELLHGYPAAVAAQIAGIALTLDVSRTTPPAASCPTERASTIARAEDQLFQSAQLIIARAPAIEARIRLASPEVKVCLSEDIVPTPPFGDALSARADPGAFVFGYVGHPAAEINIESFAGLLRGLVERDIDARLAIFGVGSRVQTLGDQLELAGLGSRVNIFEKTPLGRRLDAAFQVMDVVAVPLLADEEAIEAPFAIIAALRCGKCVVAVGAEDHQDFFRDAILYASDSAGATDVLADLAKSPELRRAQESRALAWNQGRASAEALISAIRTL